MKQPIILITFFCFLSWIMPLGFLSIFPSGGHAVPAGCLCGGSLNKTAKYTKYLLEDACHGKQPNKFGGLANNDLFVCVDQFETLLTSNHSSFQYSFLYNFRIYPSVEHVPKTILS